MTVALVLAAAEVGRGEQRVLAGVDLTLHTGELGVLEGPSGSGKSTLLAVAAGLLAPLGGRAQAHVGPIGWVPQELREDGPFPVSLVEFVASGGRRSWGPWRRPGPAERARVRALLGGLGLAGEGDRPLAAHSGGERQRALVARALAATPALLVLDEPTSALDGGSAAAVVDAVLGAAAGGAAVLVATHHPQPLVAGAEGRGIPVRRWSIAGGRLHGGTAAERWS